MQIDSVQLSRKHLIDNPDYKMDYKITVEYEPYTETDDEQESFRFRKSIRGNRDISGNHSAIHKLNYYSNKEDE